MRFRSPVVCFVICLGLGCASSDVESTESPAGGVASNKATKAQPQNVATGPDLSPLEKNTPAQTEESKGIAAASEKTTPSSKPAKQSKTAESCGESAPNATGQSAHPSDSKTAVHWGKTADAPRYLLKEEGRGPVLATSDGKPMLLLSPTLTLQRVDKLGGVPLDETAPVLEWTCSENSHFNLECSGTGETDDREWTIRWRGTRFSPILECEIEVRYKRTILNHQESLTFETGALGHPWLVGRDQQIHAVDETHFVDQWTHKVVFFGADNNAFALDAGTGIQGLWAKPAGEDAITITLELDHADNHPYTRYNDCWKKYKSSQERKVRQLNQWRRTSGEVAEYHFSLYLGNVSPLRIARLPKGFRGAVTFTDHADQSSVDKLKALLYGASDANPQKSTGGFIGRGLGLTKTVFTLTREDSYYAEQLDNGRYYQSIYPATARVPSFDVGSHSPSGYKDSPSENGVIESLQRMRALGESHGRVRPLVWIDHQPSTNCEALANQGIVAESRWFIMDRLVELGFRFFWSVGDINTRGHLNILQPGRHAKRSPLLFRQLALERDAGLSVPIWFWKSIWTFSKKERFYRLFSTENLDELAAQEGIHVAHSYLDTYRTRGSLAKKTHFYEDDGVLRTSEGFAAVLDRLRSRQANGDLWTTGASSLFEHLTLLLSVKITYNADGTATVSNAGQQPIKGLTLYVPESSKKPLSIMLDGTRLPETAERHLSSRKLFWFDLDAGESKVVQILDETNTSRPFLRPVRVVSRFKKEK